MLRRNWLAVLGCVAVFVVGVVIAQGGSPYGYQGPLGYLVAWFGLMFGPVFIARNAFPRARPCTFRATQAGLTLAGLGEVASEDILEIKIVPRPVALALVELTFRGPGPKKLTLRTAEHDARALLALFGVRRTRFRLMVPYWKRFLGSFLALDALLALSSLFGSGNIETLLVALPGCAVYAALITWLIGYVRGSVVVGADGFTTRWLFRERFTAFRDVAAVRGETRIGIGGASDTMVDLASGRKIRLRTVEAPNNEQERGTEARAMLAHMQEAFTRSSRLVEASVDVPALVQRGERTASEWLSGIDALVRGGGSRYRVAAVSSEMLSELASDPRAPVETRVGAAAALIRMGDDSLRARVRVAAEACAESDLRDTLLALSDARDDETAEKALGLLRRR